MHTVTKVKVLTWRGSQMGVSLTSIARVGKEQLVSSHSSGEPNWSYIPTKGKCLKTQAEFETEIKELAREAATATNKTEDEYISKKVLHLKAEYLSDVAPDRKKLYQQAKKAIKNHSSNLKCMGCGELTLLDFLEKTGKENNNLAQKEFVLAGGGVLSCPILTGGGYGAEIHYQGEMVLSNHGGGWGYEMTPAELTKDEEFYSIYWNEYHSVKDGVNLKMREIPNYLDETKASFEVKV